jgi:hypothetical protein
MAKQYCPSSSIAARHFYTHVLLCTHLPLDGRTVEVLAIVAKAEAESWLARFGSPE